MSFLFIVLYRNVTSSANIDGLFFILIILSHKTRVRGLNEITH